ncbi:MAG TPA: serpin family protein [Xanthobacteraceae bacterium]|nr:serpin family protein [Xanthobacteraceae bacterium]
MISVRRMGCALAVALAVTPHACIPVEAEDAAKVRELMAAYNASGHDHFVKFAATPRNVVFSPYSIGTAMAMTLSGARGDTAAEMARVLKQTLARDAMDAANADALATLNGYDKHGAQAVCPDGTTLVPGADGFGMRLCEGPMPPDGRCPAGFFPDTRRCLTRVKDPASARFRAADALMLPRGGGVAISADYAALLKDKYFAELFRDADLGMINGWVSRQTEGKVDRILDRLPPDTEAVILNAVYFNAAWQKPFSERATRDDDFNLTPTEKVKVKMMHAKDRYPVLSGPGYRALRLPYSVEALSMVIVLPDDIDGATRLARDLDAAELARLFNDLRVAKEVEIAVPRFKADFMVDLIPLFRQAGMTRAFTLGVADFSGMTGGARAAVAIGDIKHRAVIDVNERGTEAAAATVIVMLSLENRAEIKPFVVDRPFLFYITDAATGAILFEGWISDPRQQL